MAFAFLSLFLGWILFLTFPMFVNQVQLLYYHLAVAAMKQFGPGVQKGIIDGHLVEGIMFDHHYKYSKQSWVHSFICHEPLKIHFEGHFKQGIILSGKFEHPLSPGPVAAEDIYFYLENQNHKWLVKTISNDLSSLKKS